MVEERVNEVLEEIYDELLEEDIASFEIPSERLTETESEIRDVLFILTSANVSDENVVYPMFVSVKYSEGSFFVEVNEKARDCIIS